MRRKSGLVQFLQLAITSAINVIHAWQFKFQIHLAITMSNQVPQKKKVSFFKVTTGTPITSH